MPNGTIDPNHDYVAGVSEALQRPWPTIAAAKTAAIEVHTLLCDELRPFTSDDVDLVVFGSLARQEWTQGSDVDWTMLVDGQVDVQHGSAAQAIRAKLQAMEFKGQSLKAPGTEGIFGSIAFSHEIVHHIGGQADTNRNTTQRILMLLEATALRAADDVQGGPFERVLRQILNRYLISDSNFHSQADHDSRIPRFLLNDIVRYWRTMCVDFAYKDWEQAGRKWAIRNIKLRTSRKLLFVAGLFTVFSCFRNNTLLRDAEGCEDYTFCLQAHLLNFVRATPLNIVAWTLETLGLRELCGKFLDHYEQFLARVNGKEFRDHLGSLSEKKVYDDERFLACRKISHDLQSVLKNACFDTESELRSFMCEYGVF
jgi:predicted nucleotidyltransferase